MYINMLLLILASRDRGAFVRALDANRALLERPGDGNFRETGWLRTQTRRLEQEIEI